MKNQLQGLKDWKSIELPHELLSLVQAPFSDVDGCLVLESLRLEQTNVSPLNFPDKTGFESFVNHIHLDDYVEDRFLDYALKSIHLVFDNYRKQFTNPPLCAIVAINESGCTVRFHVIRNNEKLLDDNLDKYLDEAVLVVNSFEVI